MPVRGIRGAITVTENSEPAMLDATRRLLEELVTRNTGFDPQDVASAWFTVTPDLDAVFPAKAARQFGWISVPLMCTGEIPVPGSLPMCIRVLVHWNTEKRQDEIHHVYLEKAKQLRPDLN